MNILVFSIELRFSLLFGFRSKRCPEQLESMKQSITELGAFITCNLVSCLMTLNLYLGVKIKTKRPVFHLILYDLFFIKIF